MNENQFKPIVAEILTSFGFAIALIPRNAKMTPDFEVKAGTERTLLELKLKGDDPNELAEDAIRIAQDEIVHRSEPLSPWNTISSIVSTGVTQLETHDPTREAFRAIWIHSWGKNQELLNELVVSTIFGTQTLWCADRSGIIKCYYYGESSFFSHRRALDGIITSIDTGPNSLEISLCVNTLSPRVEQFRASKLYEAFKAGLTDPDLLEKSGDVWIADCPIDRSKEQAPLVLEYLRKKYAVSHLQPFTLQQHNAMASIKGWNRWKTV